MIHRYYQEGPVLNVADLNEMIVLIDRTETELTELALNTWRKGLTGPPHCHEQKEQIFYIVAGTGRVHVGGEIYPVKVGDLVYVPRGVEHQTIAAEDEALDYILFNVFHTAEKEGHGTFAEHIEKVKQIRRQQADSGKSAVAEAEQGVASGKSARHISDFAGSKLFEFGSNTTRLLLERNETEGFEMVLVSWPPGNTGALVAHKEKEQTFFVISGSGWVVVGEEEAAVKPGDLVFVPRNTPHTTRAGAEQLTYLCLNALIGDIQDDSFEQMYNRIAPARIERWRRGDSTVGE
jgi:mannose-6-phosphate isomerase-like protein (cupin superfamily)